MASVDITHDLMDQDETAHVWPLLHEARSPLLLEVPDAAPIDLEQLACLHSHRDFSRR